MCTAAIMDPSATVPSMSVCAQGWCKLLACPSSQHYVRRRRQLAVHTFLTIANDRIGPGSGMLHDAVNAANLLLRMQGEALSISTM